MCHIDCAQSGAGKVRESDRSLNVEARQRREIARLQHKALTLKAELERMTGKPLELTSEDRQRLATPAAEGDQQDVPRLVDERHRESGE
jgi:hypothetical protein